MHTNLISIPTPTHPLDGAYYTPEGPKCAGPLRKCQAGAVSGLVHSGRQGAGKHLSGRSLQTELPQFM